MNEIIVDNVGISTSDSNCCFIQTKLWQSGHGRTNALKKTEESFKYLGLQYNAGKKNGGLRMRRPLDAMLIHHP